ncbi:hypothetical protein TrRE_jg4853 [Triparma retinervis]|uniref:Uncharacterized protein n=1 Tax=Triparma retinervis TaxID=2557542 RepID=A0A9W7E7A7_9STRA|nr:hypothetical protein TrRE_jg4853 [Triparma retinervis]
MWWNWTVAICLYLLYFLRVVLLHEFSVAAKTAGFIVTIGFIIAHGSIWQKEYEYHAVNGHWSENNPPVFTNPMIAFAFPLIFATTFLVSEGCQSIKKVMKAASILLIFGLFESAAIFVLQARLFYMFFSSGTGALTRFAIRLFTPLVLKGVFIELCAVFAPFLSNLLETEIYPVSVALFAPIGCAADLVGRLFQSSAENLMDSVVLELSGTLAEIYTADGLLQGKTKLDKLFVAISWCLGQSSPHSPDVDKVHPQESINSGDELNELKVRRRTTFDHSSDSEESAGDKNKRQKTEFCATVMIMTTITEASGLVVGSLFWICCNANPSSSGGESLDVSQAMLNFVIMLFGELVLSDSVVAYLSHKFESRYVISIAHEWEEFRQRQGKAIMGIIVIISFISSTAIMQIPNQLCLTSHMSHEEDWALTQCPRLCNETILLRVEDMFLTEEWEEWAPLTC